jgi:hypothetical protein
MFMADTTGVSRMTEPKPMTKESYFADYGSFFILATSKMGKKKKIVTQMC